MPFFIKILLIISAISCNRDPSQGILEVKAPGPGQFEIYKIVSSSPLEFISEKVGRFNKPMAMPPGNYLILADCSSKITTVKPSVRNTLIAHEIVFNTPEPAQKSDLFKIQCNRHSETQSRQTLLSKYRLNILDGKRDLLVGMRPLYVDLKGQKPTVKTYNLGSIKLNEFDGMKPGARYFVSPKNSLIALTSNQKFGQRQFLLPGSYVLEVNGTQTEVLLATGGSIEIDPAFIRIQSKYNNEKQNQSSSLESPELNSKYTLDVNETYPVLPSEVHVNFSGSKDIQTVPLSSGHLSIIEARSLYVESDCSPWDWTCLKRIKVYIYQRGLPYPTTQSRADKPIFYLNKHAEVCLQGTTDIRHKIPADKYHHKLRVGRVRLIPKPTYRAGILTDLVRIEADTDTSYGQSLDINLKKSEVIPLIAGQYKLVTYSSLVFSENDRQKLKKTINVIPGQEIAVSYNVYYHRTDKMPKDYPLKSLGKKKRPINLSKHQLIPTSLN